MSFEASTPAARLARQWLPLLTRFFTLQTATQLVSVAAGFLIVRSLSTTEFAFYALVTSTLTFLSFASDLGATQALGYFFREADGDARRQAIAVSEIESTRNLLLWVSTVPAVVVFPSLAVARGFPWWQTVTGLVALVAFCGIQMRVSVRLAAIRFQGRLDRSFVIEATSASARLSLVVALLAVGLRSGWIMAVSAIASPILALLLLRSETSLGGSVTRARRSRRVLNFLRPTIPSSIHYAFRGALVTWLAAAFGSTRVLAEVGALGRLGFLFAVIGRLPSAVLLPRLSAIRDDALMAKRILQFGGALVGLSVALVLLVAWVPSAFLVLLGGTYEALRKEAVLVAAGAAIQPVLGLLVEVNLLRGWLRWHVLATIVTVLAEVLLVVLLPLGTTRGVLWFGIASGLVTLGGQAAITAVGFSRHSRLVAIPVGHLVDAELGRTEEG